MIPTGRLKGLFDKFEAERKDKLVQQLKVNEELLQSMREQLSVSQAIQGNLKQQEATVKEIAMGRAKSLTAYGMLDPFQQQAAVQTAVALKEGRALTREQMAIGGQVPEIADYMQRQAASRAINDPGYQKILDLVGRPQDATQFAKSRDLANKVQLQPGQTKIEVFVQVDEQVLAKAIRDELKGFAKEIEVLQKDIARRVAEAEGLRERQSRDRAASLGNHAPGF